NETVTTLVNNNDGTYTYTNEAGATFVIDVPSSVVNQFEEIYNDIVNEQITVNGDTYNSFEEYLSHIANESVNIDGGDMIEVTGTGTAGDPYVVSIAEGVANSMLITNASGDLEWATIADIVQANETVTTLVNNNDGTYTYTSEDGTVTTVDVPSDIVNQFENIVKDGPVTVDGDTYNTIEEYIQHIVETNDTNTTNASFTIDGTNLVITDSDSNTVEVALADIAAEVDTNTISVVTPVITTGNTIATHDDGAGTTVEIKESITVLSYDEDEKELTYVDEEGEDTVIDIAPTASNGLTVGTGTHSDKDVKLGGDLIENTVINQDNFSLEIATNEEDLIISGLDKSEVQATVNGATTTGITQHLLAVDENNNVKALKAAMPKFFYMPSIIVPTSEEQLNNPASGQVTGDAFDDNTLQGTINLFGRYEAQFGTPMV